MSFQKECTVTKLLLRMSRLNLFLLFSFLVLFVALPNDLTAAESVNTEEWDITADKIIRYEKPMSIVAEGNIVLIKRKKIPPQQSAKDTQATEWSELLEEEAAPVEVAPIELDEETEDTYQTQVTIKADWVAYDIALSSINARGNVSIVTGSEQLFAEQAIVNLEQETGTFKNATIIRDDKDMHLEGEVIEKTGFKTYHIENGWVITCKVKEGETPPWSFAASDVVIEQGGYATLKHAKFKIMDVPVLYSPWLILPIKNKRQTGFLFPEISSTENNGFGFNLPFFWNISESTDMTLYTEYMVNRGYMPSLEFNYVKSASDKGLAMVSYLSDELTDPSETEYYQDTGFTHTNKDRYWLRGKADHEFGQGWTSRLDIDIVSDRDYLTEFNTGMSGFQDSNDRFLDKFGRSLENKTDDQRTNFFGLLKSWGGMSLTAELLGINDVRDDKSGDSPLWNLPTVDFTGVLPFEDLYGVNFEWDATYHNFWREEGVGGHRVDLYPRLSAPLPLGPYLESRAEAGLRDTYYMVQEYGDAEWAEDDSQNRLTYDLHAEVGTTLMRTYGLSGEEVSGFRHQVRPFVDYDFLPEQDQDELPYFDGVDRLSQRNEISYGIDNFFDLVKASDDGDDAGADSVDEDGDYGSLKIRQSYSFLDENSDEPFSDINVRLRWRPISAMFFDYRTDIDPYDDGFVRHNLEGTYSNSRGDYFSLEYIFDATYNTEQVNALVTTALFANWRADLKIQHSITENQTNEADVALIYQALCWSVELATQYTPTDTSIVLMFNLANIGSPLGFTY
jgi:LPS-assembly protein